MSDGLRGKRILVVDDEYFIAQELAKALTAEGAEVQGPFASEESAQQALSTQKCHAAILDSSSTTKSSFVLADLLSSQRVPVAFATGVSERHLPDRFANIPVFTKPYSSAAIIDWLRTIP